MYIILSGYFFQNLSSEETATNIEEFKTICDRPMRRSDRYINLAMLGVCNCIGKATVPADTGLYLATGQGNLSETLTVMDQIFLLQQSPMPFNFVNTLSNTAGFYIAAAFGITGSNILVSRNTLSFEAGMEIALCDMQSGVSNVALVGGLDCAVFPLEYQRSRMGLSPDTPLAEGSAWFLISKEDHYEEHSAIGKIHAVESFTDPSLMSAWLEKFDYSKLPDGELFFSYGPNMSVQAQSDLQKVLPTRTKSFNWINSIGYLDTKAAVATAAFLEQNRNSSLIHMEIDINQNASAFVLSRF